MKIKYPLAIVVFLFLSALFARTEKNIESDTPNSIAKDTTSLTALEAKDSSSIREIREQLIACAKEYIGTPYRYGGRTPEGFDCSGFVCYVFKKIGQTLPASSRGMATIGSKVAMKDCKSGDIILFEGRKQNGITGHVGIVCNVDSSGLVSFIHASTTRNVIVSTMKEEYYDNRFLQIRRIAMDGK